MNRRHFKLLSAAIALASLTALFQQCSDVKFGEEAYSSELGDNGVGLIFQHAEPVLAVRASGCITCHANIHSGYLTDFGYGSPFYLGNGSSLAFNSGSIYGDHGGSWSMSLIQGQIFVPKTPAATRGTFNGTLASYIASQEALKPAANRAPVIEKNEVYIGAPSAATLRARFQLLPGAKMKFLRFNSASPFLTGLTAQPEGYFKNTADLVCDGDVLVDGVVLLDNPVVRTIKGCRIYATGTIFLQGSVTYNKLNTDADDKSNLQLSSSRAVMMGVGTSHCESQSYPGRYHNEAAAYGPNPLKRRLVDMWTVPGQFTREQSAAGRTPAAEGQLIVNDANLIPGGVMDASCFPQRREVELEHLLVNAPNVQSRYRANFSGVIIAEMAVGSLGQFKFEFDQIFKSVPVLPLLNQSDFLLVK